MKKKIMLSLLLLCFVNVLVMAQGFQCYDATQAIKYQINGTTVTFFNASNSKNITVKYEIRYKFYNGQHSTKILNNTMIISPNNSISINAPSNKCTEVKVVNIIMAEFCD